MRRRQIFAERQREHEYALAGQMGPTLSDEARHMLAGELQEVNEWYAETAPRITREEPKKRGWPLGKKRGPRK